MAREFTTGITILGSAVGALSTTGTPSDPGTASRGASSQAARADHVHTNNLVAPTLNAPVLGTVQDTTTLGDDFALGANVSVLRYTGTAAATLNGIAAAGPSAPADGRVLVLVNATGLYGVTLAHGAASSTAAYRLQFGNAGGFVLSPYEAIMFVYDGSANRWKSTHPYHIIGNAGTATKLSSTRTFALTGDATGSVSSDLTSGASIATTVATLVGDSGSGGTKGLVPAPAAGDAAASKYLKADGTWTTVSSTGAPTNATYVTTSSDATLTNERVLTQGTGVTVTDNGTTSVTIAAKLSDSTSTTDSTTAASATAVKSAYDLAAAAVPKSTVTTAGDLIVATGSGAVTRLAAGSTSGQVLTSNGTGVAPTYQAVPAAAAGTLTGTTLASGVTASSLTSFGASPTVTTPALTLSTTTSTTDGRIAWDTANDQIEVGNGTALVTFGALGSSNGVALGTAAAGTAGGVGSGGTGATAGSGGAAGYSGAGGAGGGASSSAAGNGFTPLAGGSGGGGSGRFIATGTTAIVGGTGGNGSTNSGAGGGGGGAANTGGTGTTTGGAGGNGGSGVIVICY